MGQQNNILPNDAPDELAQLLERWQDVAVWQLPTLADLAFDDLVGQHPGLMLVEPAPGKNGQPDLKIIRADPE